VIKKTWWIAWLLATALLLLSASSVYATAVSTSTSTSTSTTNAGFKIWPAKTTTEVNKVWEISFNAPLLSSSVNSNCVYVTDSKQTKVSTTINLSADGLSVTVAPAKAYTAGDYNLYITNGLTSWASEQLSEMIIVPFTVTLPTPVIVPPKVIVPTTYPGSVNLVVTVTDDFKAAYASDLSGSLWLEGLSGNRLAPASWDLLTGKYTFSIYVADDYSLNLFSVSNGVINTRLIKLPAIKLPKIKLPLTGSEKPTVKTANLMISTKEGVAGAKSGAIGGGIIPAKWGVPVTITNATSTWTTRTDIDGNFLVYLPTGSYQLDIEGNDVRYKKHRFKLTVAAGQMASPVDTINAEELINKLGLRLDTGVDAGLGVLSGIDTTTTQIDGSVNSDAVVEIYDTALIIPKKIVTAKPDKDGKFVAKLPKALSGKKLQINVIDSAGNTYTLETVAAL